MIWTGIAACIGCFAAMMLYGLTFRIATSVAWMKFGWRPKVLDYAAVDVTARDCTKQFMDNIKKERPKEIEGLTKDELRSKYTEMLDYTKWAIEIYSMNYTENVA